MAKPLSELRKMQRNQLVRVSKDELIESILSSDDESSEQFRTLNETLQALISEISQMKNAINSPDGVVNKRFLDLQAQINKQGNVLAKQQQFLEVLDRKERERNLVVLGTPEDGQDLDGAVTDCEKLQKIWSKMGVQEELASYRRLGNVGNRKRPILVTMTTKDGKFKMLEKASQLKNMGGIYNTIYVKKDVHPSVREEWKRLRNVEAAEKENPANVGCVIRLDTKERKVFRDDVVIDSWNAKFF